MMTARERTVLRAIVAALRGGSCTTMDAYATCYRVGEEYYQGAVRARAAKMLYALIDEDTSNRKKRRKNGLDTHQHEP